jgi:hypothetical protein
MTQPAHRRRWFQPPDGLHELIMHICAQVWSPSPASGDQRTPLSGQIAVGGVEGAALDLTGLRERPEPLPSAGILHRLHPWQSVEAEVVSLIDEPHLVRA